MNSQLGCLLKGWLNLILHSDNSDMITSPDVEEKKNNLSVP